MVTEEAVWSALAEVEDPEIPVISLVDLGVVRDVRVEGERVHVEFTPTFLGCPALEVMRDQMTEAIEELGGEAEVEVVVDDSWSTDRITPEGREKLRAAGFAPPAPREAGTPKLVQLHERRLPLPVLRLDRDEAGKHLRPDPVPVDPLLRELPPAVRAVQDDLVRDTARTALMWVCGSSASTWYRSLVPDPYPARPSPYPCRPPARRGNESPPRRSHPRPVLEVPPGYGEDLECDTTRSDRRSRLPDPVEHVRDRKSEMIASGGTPPSCGRPSPLPAWTWIETQRRRAAL